MAEAVVVPAVVETPIEPVIPTTLAEHRAMFPADGSLPVAPVPSVDEPASEEPTAPKTRHRAKSQRASVEDVPRIQELTKRLRQTEDELKTLKERVTPPVPAAAASPPASAFAPPPPLLAAFAEPSPTIDQFATSADAYGDHQRALIRWELRKEQAETQQRDALAATKQWQATQQQVIQQNLQTFGTRYQAYKQTVPDYDMVVANAHQQLTPLLMSAIIEDPRGPEFILHLAQNPDTFDELLLLTDGKPVGPETVALTRRRLAVRMPAVATGSVAPPPVIHAPRPPNPVRTGPQPSSEPDSSEPAATLAEHRRRFPVSHRR